MRNLADLACPECGKTYYGDLLAGHGLYFPMLLDKSNGHVYDRLRVPWFAQWLEKSYRERRATPLVLHAEALRPIRRPLLLNCLDVLYGHSLLKLLNAQYYLDHAPEYDLILLIPHFLRWMVPDGASAIWTVDWSLKNGAQWHDRLDAELHQRLDSFPEVFLSKAFSHPHPKDYDISRFTGVRPFRIDRWDEGLQRPKVTFIWRDDRPWTTSRPQKSRGLGNFFTAWQAPSRDPVKDQLSKVISLDSHLRSRFGNLQFAVAGIGDPGGLPAWIDDMRCRRVDADREKEWCELYARSHVVIGVHGSNMLLPSGHAGASIDLMPEDRWGNMLQDILFRPGDERELMFRHRFIQISTGPMELAVVARSLLEHHRDMQINMGPDFCEHDTGLDLGKWAAARKNHLRQWGG